MKKMLLFAIAFAAIGFFVADDADAHGGSFRGPNGGVPPGLRQPTDPQPPPPPPTTPTAPGAPTTPNGPTGPATPTAPGPATPRGPTPPPSTGPANGPKKGPNTKSLTFESWRFWWAYNNDDILNLKTHIYGSHTSSASPLFFTSKADEANRRNAQRPTERAIVQKIIPALLRSLNRKNDHEDIHGGALVALGKVGTIEFVSTFEAAAFNRFRTDRGIKVKFGYQATESAVLALGLLPKLDARGKAEVRKVLLDVIDSDEMRSRERAWAAVCLGLQKDVGAVEPLWERLSRKYTGENKENVLAGLLCGIGLIGDESIRPRLEAALKTGKIEGHKIKDRIRAYVAYAISKIANPDSLDVLSAVLNSRRYGRVVKRSVAIAMGTCAANATDDRKKEAVSILKKFLTKKSGGDPSGENFAIIALSQIGTKNALDYLIKLCDSGKYGQRPYAALGLGTRVWYTDRAAERKEGERMDPVMRGNIRDTLTKLSKKYKDTDTKAAFMLARALCKDKTAIPECVKLVSRQGDPVLRGFSAVSLGLIGEASEDVKDALGIALAERKSTDLRRDAATALGLLRDADAVKTLIEELKRAKSFAVQGQLITAIGTIGDHTAIDPLIDILDNTNRPAVARAMAAVGLGMIGDLLELSKLSRLSKNYNYRASLDDLDELLFIL